MSSPVIAPPSRPWSWHSWSNQDWRPRIEDTPSRGKFLKESLDFPELEPAVLKCLPRIRFLLWKT
jgi:hypothetical protein